LRFETRTQQKQGDVFSGILTWFSSSVIIYPLTAWATIYGWSEISGSFWHGQLNSCDRFKNFYGQFLGLTIEMFHFSLIKFNI